MKRGNGDVSVEVTIDRKEDGGWWDALTKPQRNDIRDRIDSICDDLTAWVP